MPSVHFTGNLQRHLDVASAEVAGATVSDCLKAVFAANPRLRHYLLDDQGRLRKHVNIFVNDTAVADRDRLSDPVKPGDALYVFQALSGGAEKPNERGG